MYEDNRGYAQVGSYTSQNQERLGNQAKQAQVYMEKTEPCRVEVVVSVELKQLEEAISEANQAAQDLVSRISPILFFGPEKACASGDPDCPPGSDVARTLNQLRSQLMRTVYFLREIQLKVNL